MSPLFTLFLVTSFANIATPGIGAVMAVNLGLSQGGKEPFRGVWASQSASPFSL